MTAKEKHDILWFLRWYKEMQTYHAFYAFNKDLETAIRWFNYYCNSNLEKDKVEKYLLLM
jgi:competence CoiA-like predicted nuclease